MNRYRVTYDIACGFWVDADSIEEATARAQVDLVAYPEIGFRIELEDE